MNAHPRHPTARLDRSARRGARRALAVAAVGVVLLAGLAATDAAAQDIRRAQRQAEADRERAEQEAAAIRQQILQDRARLVAVVDSLEARQAALQAELDDLAAREKAAAARRDRLQEQWAQEEIAFRELSGNVRVAARDLESLLRSSPLTAAAPGRLDTVARLLREGYFPDLEDIRDLARVALDEARRTGQVTLRRGEFGGRDGRDTEGEILHLGRFTTAYRTEQELGFLLWNPDSQRLVAMAEPPAGGVAGQLRDYLAGESALVPVDLSGGRALRQVARRPSLLEQIEQGGPIVWPLGLIAALALGVAIWKALHLQRVHANTDRIMHRVNAEAARGDWAACAAQVGDDVCRRSPVARVVRAGLDVRGESREIQESVLQEAILHEMPLLQRGLAMLAVFGAVAPLLGLLGTVTGMIETFRVITLHGTGDPKLMSGGISEALVTTEIGLAIAIPVMLAHTWLKRRTDHVVGDMEEQAMHLVNTIDRQRDGGGPPPAGAPEARGA
jgi:biopolymer transport protein ExbB